MLSTMRGVSTVPRTSITVPQGRSKVTNTQAIRAPQSASTASAAGRSDAAWKALVGSSIAAVVAGRRLSRNAAHGRKRAAGLALKATRVDAIHEAAADLAKASYPFIQEVPWNSDEFTLTPGTANPIGWAKAIGKIIDHGSSMDGELVKVGCDAHHTAMVHLPPSGVCTEKQMTDIYSAIGHMIASAPESKTMEVYNSVKALVDPKVPEYLMSKVTEANAKTAYEALLKFTEVVQANPIDPSTPETAISSSATSEISTAAAELGSAAYPFMKGVDWTSDLYGKPVPGRSAQEVMKAIDKMIVMGAEMDSAAVKEAALAHVKAIEGMDSKGVLTQEAFVDVLTGLGKAISSVPKSSVMGVYGEMGNFAGLGSGIPQYNFSQQDAGNAVAAYNALMNFKDTVGANQPDAIDTAAIKLARVTYPFMKEVPWNDYDFLLTPGAANPIGYAKAIGKIIDMGASMDGDAVKYGCRAHHAAITDLPADGVCSEAELVDIYASIGRMIASVPESKTMGVYYALSNLVDPKVPEYLMSKVSESNARAAYEGLMEFKDVVKANFAFPAAPATTVSRGAASGITAAANKLGDVAYPFMQGVDWTDDVFSKQLPGKSPQDVLKAVDKMIVMGESMDWAALQEAAKAHAFAIESMDTKGVLTQGYFKAILAGLGKAISSVPEAMVMDVYNEMGKLVDGEQGQVPTNLLSKQNPGTAMAAYEALMQFKDTVKANQPDAIGAAAVKLSEASYPFIQQVPWNSYEFLMPPGKANPIEWTKAIGKIIDMGASMDAELVKAGCEAHHAAIVNRRASGVCSLAEMTDIYASIGRMIASVPESKTMEVYEAVKALVDPKVPEYLMSKVSEKDAKAAYEALLAFADVVKANPRTPSAPVTTVSGANAASIGAAASELGKAAYPFVQGINWMDDLYSKPIPGRSAKDAMFAIDSMIVLGTQLDSAALQEAARAHVKAIEGMDAKGVLKQGDFEAILAGLGKAISGAPEGSVMDVYNAMNNFVGGSFGLVPTNLLSMQSAADAGSAYTAFLGFKDKVRAAQPKQPNTIARTGASGPAASDSFAAAAILFLLATVLPNIMVSP